MKNFNFNDIQIGDMLMYPYCGTMEYTSKMYDKLNCMFPTFLEELYDKVSTNDIIRFFNQIIAHPNFNLITSKYRNLKVKPITSSNRNISLATAKYNTDSGIGYMRLYFSSINYYSPINSKIKTIRDLSLITFFKIDPKTIIIIPNTDLSRAIEHIHKLPFPLEYLLSSSYILW